jgi:hypothetical protein
LAEQVLAGASLPFCQTHRHESGIKAVQIMELFFKNEMFAEGTYLSNGIKAF